MKNIVFSCIAASKKLLLVFAAVMLLVPQANALSTDLSGSQEAADLGALDVEQPLGHSHSHGDQQRIGSINHSDKKAAKVLSVLLASMSNMKSNFYQRVTTAEGELVEEASGEFYLSKPGRFRWNYVPEEGEALGNVIVSDGEKLSMYDAELETLSSRSLQEVFDQVPSLVLVLKDVELDSLFLVTNMGLVDGGNWFKLTPVSQDLTYEYLQIALKEDGLSAMKVKDASGQLISIEFDEVATQVKMSDQLFAFNVPEGTDILSQ